MSLCMTAGELMAVLKEVPADTPVGRDGHFGELRELYGAHVSTNTVEPSTCENNFGRSPATKTLPLAVILEIGDIGELDD
jgi:hypothetical protein